MIESIVTTVVTVVFVAMVLVLLMFAFAQGVVHSAVDQGVRAGSRLDVDSVSTCEARIRQALSNVIPGAAGGASVTCGESGGVVTGTVEVTVSGGIPPFSSVHLKAGGEARKEVAPG